MFNILHLPGPLARSKVEALAHTLVNLSRDWCLRRWTNMCQCAERPDRVVPYY